MASMRNPPDDTSVASWHTQLGILARMDPESRVRAAIELSDAVRELQIQGILVRNPDWSRRHAIELLTLRLVGGEVDRP